MYWTTLGRERPVSLLIRDSCSRVLVSIRRRVPDEDVDWYLRILAIADLDRRFGAAPTILDTVHVPRLHSRFPHEYVRRWVTTKLLSVATKRRLRAGSFSTRCARRTSHVR